MNRQLWSGGEPGLTKVVATTSTEREVLLDPTGVPVSYERGTPVITTTSVQGYLAHKKQRPPKPYRGTSLTRNSAVLGPYSRTMPRLLWRS